MDEPILDFDPQITRKYATVWVRLIAGMVDILFLAMVFYVFALLTGVVVWTPRSLNFLQEVVPGVLVVSVTWLYFAGFESSELKATPGKLAFRIQVVDAHQERLTFKKTTVRFFAKLASVAIALIGIVLIAIQKNRQGLHDRFCGSWVVYRMK